MEVTRVHHNPGFRAAYFGSGSHDLGITTIVKKKEGFLIYRNPQRMNVPLSEIRVVGRSFDDPSQEARFHTIAIATNNPGKISHGPQEIESTIRQDRLIPLEQAA